MVRRQDRDLVDQQSPEAWEVPSEAQAKGWGSVLLAGILTGEVKMLMGRETLAVRKDDHQTLL